MFEPHHSFLKKKHSLFQVNFRTVCHATPPYEKHVTSERNCLSYMALERPFLIPVEVLQLFMKVLHRTSLVGFNTALLC